MKVQENSWEKSDTFACNLQGRAEVSQVKKGKLIPDGWNIPEWKQRLLNGTTENALDLVLELAGVGQEGLPRICASLSFLTWQRTIWNRTDREGSFRPEAINGSGILAVQALLSSPTCWGNSHVSTPVMHTGCRKLLSMSGSHSGDLSKGGTDLHFRNKVVWGRWLVARCQAGHLAIIRVRDEVLNEGCERSRDAEEGIHPGGILLKGKVAGWGVRMGIVKWRRAESGWGYAAGRILGSEMEMVSSVSGMLTLRWMDIGKWGHLVDICQKLEEVPAWLFHTMDD